MKRTALLLILAALFSTASARFYFGFPTTVSQIGSQAYALGGLQVGNYTATPHFGWRALAETNYGLGGSDFQLGADFMYTNGTYDTFYVGGGLGLLNGRTNSGYSGTLAYVTPVIGLDFDTGSTLSYFIELTPRYYVGTQVAVTGRAGINFQLGLGQASAAPVRVPVAVRVTPTAPQVTAPVSRYVDGKYIDADGNVWLEPWDGDK